MKKYLFVFALAACFAPIQSFANVWVHNEDSQSYTVKAVCEGGRTIESSLSANSSPSQPMTDASSCEVQVVGVGSITPAEGETVVIRNGSLFIK